MIQKIKRLPRLYKKGKYKSSLSKFLGPIIEKVFLLTFFVYEILDICLRFSEPFSHRLGDSSEIFYKIVIEMEELYRKFALFPEFSFILLYLVFIRDRLKLSRNKIYNNYFIQFYAMHYLTIDVEKNFLYGLYKRICVYPRSNFSAFIAAFCIVAQVLFCLDCILCIVIDRYVHIQFVTESIYIQLGDKRKTLT